ncbi:hypothetical protein TPA0906_34640 [Streptomyces olivaceus]|uniref:hypothetical protein n=1 Tax=Streptomyces olivaceus TaxID=47716 RepID=UPI0022EEE7D5|nr:hypothetical protein [Streptomyces olivaceus]GHJ01599.1 hypothetical protein TPA0906_34640 [Streptomyces olivaceus]
MPATNHDDLTWSEIARVVAIGAQIQRRKNRGKATKRLEKQADEIVAKAQARENARRK